MLDTITLGEKVSREMQARIEVEPSGIDSWRIFTPFVAGDGDELKIALKRKNGGWMLSDEGHTLMSLSYQNVDVDKTSRASVLEKILASSFMKNEEGRLVLDNIKDISELADCIFTFTQGLLKVSDMTMWRLEHAKSLFPAKFKEAVSAGVNGRNVIFQYQDTAHDPQGLYLIDGYVSLRNGRSAHIYAASNSERAERSAGAIYFYEKQNLMIPSAAILSASTSYGSAKLRLEAIADKVFVTPEMAAERLDPFLSKYEAA